MITRIDNISSKLKQYREGRMNMCKPKKQRILMLDQDGRIVATSPVLTERIDQQIADDFAEIAYPSAHSAVIEELDIVSPNDGGCWFCYTATGDMVFDTEFDTNLHMDCLKSAFFEGNPEAEIMSYLIRDELNSRQN
jgi:hypothetical protein